MKGFRTALRARTPAWILSAYHYSLAYAGAIRYGFPSKRLTVIGVTGTNGKSSTTEFINAIFEAAGKKTALSNSIRTKIGPRTSFSNGRSMPGRSLLQRFLRDAAGEACDVAIIEMTSEGAKQHRHRGIELSALVFLNLAPEHIESHGSFEAYADAKFQLGLSLARSSKRPRVMVANADDPQGARYLGLPVEKAIPVSLSEARPWSADERGGSFRFEGEAIRVRLPGTFYVENALAAAQLCRAFDISAADIKKGIESVTHIPGRMERIEAGQRYSLIIDYALTPDSLEALYKTFEQSRKICVFGSAGGGRDRWKRPVLGTIAEKYCDAVILTNDIAYDEDPSSILSDIARGMTKAPEILPDRRAAIRRAVELAQAGPSPEQSIVLITGMGIDTEITAADGSKIPWSDATVAREEIERARALGNV